MRYDLHDLSVEIIPDVVSWTHGPLNDTCMLCVLESRWIHNFSLEFPEAGSVSLFLSFLHGIAASIGTSNFLLACLMVS